MEFDAVIVGAGHNALAAGLHLTSRGWSVGIFERATQPGGAVRTAEVTLPGFRHDLYAMNLSLFAGSPFHAEHAQTLLEHGLAFAPAEHCFATPMRDGRWFGVSRDLDTTLARIASLSAQDVEAWQGLLSRFDGDAAHIFALLGAPMIPRAMLGVLWKAWRAKGAGWLVETARLLAASPRVFLDEQFASAEIRAALAAWGMHLDFGPDVAGGALFPYLEAMANQRFGMVIGQGGADTMIRALTGAFAAAGGALHLDAPVAEVLRENGAARGVVLADGTRVQANRAVIAGVTPQALVRLLGGTSGDARYDGAARRFRFGPGTMMIHCAMRDLPDWSAGPELSRFAYVHLAPDLGQMARTYAEAMSGLLPAEPVLVVGQPTAIDPSRAPDGQHVLWIQVRALPGAIAGDAGGSIEACNWDAAKGPYAERVLDIIERYAPGTREKILARYVLSPADLERANPSLVGGDSLAGSHHLTQNFFFRPAAGWGGWRTPVQDLYLIGASAWPGAGTGAGSGYGLAKRLVG